MPGFVWTTIFQYTSSVSVCLYLCILFLLRVHMTLKKIVYVRKVSQQYAILKDAILK